MKQNKELYQLTLERIRDRADTLYPEKIVYRQKEAAQIMGVSTTELRRAGLKTNITCEQLAKVFS